VAEVRRPKRSRSDGRPGTHAEAFSFGKEPKAGQKLRPQVALLNRIALNPNRQEIRAKRGI